MVKSEIRVEARARAMLRRWVEQADATRDVRALYLAGTYGNGFLETKCLQLTQAVEAFHRRFRDGKYLDDKTFDKLVWPSLRGAVPKGIDERLQQSVLDRIRFSNEFTLRERLESLVSEFEAPLQVLVADPSGLVQPIVNLRNEFTHFSPASRDRSAKSPTDVKRVVLYNYFLRLLIEACLLETTGFAKDEIAALVEGSKTYRQLARRFAG
jgi:hypothetical protein